MHSGLASIPTGKWEELPLEGSLKCNTILQLDLFYRKEEKWLEVPYVRTFFTLEDKPKTGRNCKLNPMLLAITTQNPPEEKVEPHPRPGLN